MASEFRLSSYSTQLYLETELMFPQAATIRNPSSELGAAPGLRAGFLEIEGAQCRNNLFMDLINTKFTLIPLHPDFVAENHYLSFNIFLIN